MRDKKCIFPASIYIRKYLTLWIKELSVKQWYTSKKLSFFTWKTMILLPISRPGHDFSNEKFFNLELFLTKLVWMFNDVWMSSDATFRLYRRHRIAIQMSTAESAMCKTTFYNWETFSGNAFIDMETGVYSSLGGYSTFSPPLTQWVKRRSTQPKTRILSRRHLSLRQQSFDVVSGDRIIWQQTHLQKSFIGRMLLFHGQMCHFIQVCSKTIVVTTKPRIDAIPSLSLKWCFDGENNSPRSYPFKCCCRAWHNITKVSGHEDRQSHERTGDFPASAKNFKTLTNDMNDEL